MTLSNSPLTLVEKIPNHVIEHGIMIAIVLMVVHAMLFAKKDKQTLISGQITKLKKYKQTIVFLWLPTLTVILALATDKLTTKALGLSLNLYTYTSTSFILALIGTLIICSYFVWSAIDVARCKQKSQDVLQQMQPLNWMLPVSHSERNWFVFGVSSSAGICEELLFRGFLLAYLSHYVSLPAAVLISSLLFGLCHLYQGWQGILKTALVGLFLAGLYLWSGSLFIVIALHFAVDAYSGQLHYGAYRKAKITPAILNEGQPSLNAK